MIMMMMMMMIKMMAWCVWGGDKYIYLYNMNVPQLEYSAGIGFLFLQPPFDHK
jgi:hypothetical protein